MIAKILVVEDESIVAKDIQVRLKRLGFNVPTIASSGEEAIRKAIEDCPALVLMDIKLAGEMDGIETARQIRSYFDIPIIYLTAYADDTTLERAKTTQASGYLIKPFKERELYTTIEMALAKHEIEMQLKENQQWLNTILRSIGDGVIANDVKELVTFMNPVAEALTGWKQEDAIGKSSTEIFNIIDAQTRTPCESPVKKALQEGVVMAVAKQTILITKNGTEIPIDESVAPIKDDQNQITGAVLVFRDISEHQRAEEARQKQIEQEQLVTELEKLNQLKDEFLSTVSHELRSPLINIKMALQMLEIASTTELRQRYLDVLKTQCDREFQLINDLLDLQQMEAAPYSSLNIEKVSLQNWLLTIVAPLQLRIQECQQTLRLNLPPDVPSLNSDRTSLERILTELLNNACKYTPAGGEIVLSVRHNSETSNSAVTIFTISNQAEIRADLLPRIFEKFYRIPKADTRKQGGTGLGLAIVQKLVEQLQGSIRVESSEGWTTFTIEFFQLEGSV